VTVDDRRPTTDDRVKPNPLINSVLSVTQTIKILATLAEHGVLAVKKKEVGSSSEGFEVDII
jgi:hypothetical protein